MEAQDSGAFPFEALVGDLQILIAQLFLDPPTRLALSLASKRLRELFWPLFALEGGYDYGAIIDKCCKVGHLKLLIHFVESGGRVDLWALDVSVISRQTAIAEWIYAALVSEPDFLSKEEFLIFHQICKHAALSGNRTLIDLFKPHDNSLNRVCYLLQGGHFDLALEHLAQVPRKEPYARHFGPYGLRFSPNIYHSSGVGDRLPVALAVLTSLEFQELGGWAPTRPCIAQVLSGAYESGSLEVLEYFTSEEFKSTYKIPVELDFARLITFEGFVRNFRGLFEELPGLKGELLKRLDSFADSACKCADLAALNFIAENGYVFSDSNVLTLLRFPMDHPNPARNDFDLEEDLRRGERVIACLAFLSSVGSTWTRSMLLYPCHWGTYSQIKWLLDRAKNPLEPIEGLTIFEVALRAPLDRPKLALLVSLGAILDDMALFTCSLHPNSVVLCEWILSHPGAVKAEMEEAVELVAKFMSERVGQYTWTDNLEFSLLRDSPLFQKHRFRVYHSLALLHLFKQRGFRLSEVTLRALRKVPNAYFQDVVQKIDF